MVDINEHLEEMGQVIFQQMEEFADSMGWSIETTIAVWASYFSDEDLKDHLMSTGKLRPHCNKRKE